MAVEVERLPDAIARATEYRLFRYKLSKKIIAAYDELREDLLKQGRQWPDGMPPTKDQRSPTEEKTIRLMMLEDKAQRESFWVKAIEDVVDILPERDRLLVQLKYFDGFLSNSGVARELHVVESVYYERRQITLQKFAERFGFV